MTKIRRISNMLDMLFASYVILLIIANFGTLN